ncbi:MAG TPA: hypothetical protein VGG01_03420 [Xanthobacteraceae bacterium]|jgi:hypothetical protein
MMDRSAYLRLLKQRLPDLRSELNEQRQIVGCEIGVLAKAAQRAIFAGDRVRVGICFEVAATAHAKGNTELEGLIENLFVHDLEFVTPHNAYPWAREMFPDSRRPHYTDYWNCIRGVGLDEGK